VLGIVFFAGGKGGVSGRVTVPPVASGLDSEPQAVVVQTDSGAASEVVGETVPANSADDQENAALVLSSPDSTPPTPETAAPRASTVEDTTARVVVLEPALEETRPPRPFDLRWATTWVNVRAGRSGSSEAVRVLNPGDQVGVDSLGRGWFRVLIDGVPVGYVDRSFLALAPPDSLPG
jgi:hypothetical protein